MIKNQIDLYKSHPSLYLYVMRAFHFQTKANTEILFFASMLQVIQYIWVLI